MARALVLFLFTLLTGCNGAAEQASTASPPPRRWALNSGIPDPAEQWLADSIQGSHNTRLSNWTGTWGTVANATTGRGPYLYKGSYGLNSHNVVHWTGSTCTLKTLSTTNPLSSATDIAIFVVFRPLSSGTGRSGFNWESCGNLLTDASESA